MTKQRTLVGLGEIRIAANGEVLAAVGLGSCVAVVLHDPGTGIGGLAHVVLPAPPPGRSPEPAGRFATTAVPRLLELVEGAGAVRGRLVARLAGGASMFNGLLSVDGVTLGDRNVSAVRSALAAAGVTLGGADVGGSHGRTVAYEPAAGRVRVSTMRRGDVEF
jgi:chemotaxis protein CheD